MPSPPHPEGDPHNLPPARSEPNPPLIAPPTTPNAPIRGRNPLRFSKRQIILAVVIAAVSDVICVSFVFAPPLVWLIDVATALLLFAVLGWHWLLLPGLIFEAIPGFAVVPFWLLVVTGITVWGTARPKLK
jgi:hypothetical protein